MNNWQDQLREHWESEQATADQALTFACWLCDEIGSSDHMAPITPELVELAGMVRRVCGIGAESLQAEVERLRGELEQARAEERERCIEVVRYAPVESAVHVRDELALAIEHLKYRP